MKNLIKKLTTGLILIGSLSGCAKEAVGPLGYDSQLGWVPYRERPYTRGDKLNRTSWYPEDTNKDGVIDQIVTPHRNSLYGTNGPVYVRGNGDQSGEIALDFSKIIRDYKNYFSQLCGSDKDIYFLCRVDDFNGDGKADQISWPRLGSHMPTISRQCFSEDMREKADKLIRYENYVLDYVENN